MASVRTIAAAVAIALGGAAPAWAGAYTDTVLDGAYSAHDVFALLDDAGLTSTGLRRFEDGLLVSFVTEASETPLDYEVNPAGAFRIFKPGAFDSGFTGSVGLEGRLAVWQRRAAPGADGQVPAGYSALRLSLARGEGRGNALFDGGYAYAALLFEPNGDWRILEGEATADGAGRFTLERADASGSGPYSVSATGETTLGTSGRGTATIDDTGDVLLQTVDLLPGRDPLFPSGAEGLAFYLRRPEGAAPALRGSYRVHRLFVRPGGASNLAVGTVTAGGNGVYFGSVGGADFNGRASIAPHGAFAVAGDMALAGAAGADGSLVLRWSEEGRIEDGGGSIELQLWVRTAGGGALPGDRDGDALSDAEEAAAGTDPDDADTDGDGLLDNADPAPRTADNTFTARLNPADIALTTDDLTPPAVALTLDSDDFPFFDWSLRANAAWLRFARTGGSGDGTVAITLDTSAFTPAGSPYTADITVTAPAMKPVSPLRLTVTVASGVTPIALTPAALAFTAVAGGLPPTPQSVAITAVETPDFAWRAVPSAAWLRAVPASGSGPRSIAVEVNPVGLAAGTLPYEAEIDFFTSSETQPAATLIAALNVLPERGVGVPFPIAAGGGIQGEPAVAVDGALQRAALAWSELGIVYGALIDTRGGPRLPRTALSLPLVGDAGPPMTALDAPRRTAWFVWRQAFGEDGLAGLQARTVNLDTLEPGNVFGIATGAAPIESPRMALDAARGRLLIAYVRTPPDLPRAVRLLLYDLVARSAIADTAVSDTGNDGFEPDLAVDGAGARLLVAWREATPGGNRIATRRFDLGTGAALAPSALFPAASAEQRLPRVALLDDGAWRIAWLESAIPDTTVGRLLSRAVDAAGVAGSVLELQSGNVSAQGHALSYGDFGEQFVGLYSNASSDNRIAIRRITRAGFFLGPPANLTPTPSPQFAPALAYNTTANEFMAVWQETGVLPVQVFAMRLAGGSTDSDGDGLPNDYELANGLDALDGTGPNGAEGDPDGDGASNRQERTMGTSPLRADTDGDGLLDPQEDRDRDGVLDPGETAAANADSDGDGAHDGVEWNLGTDGRDPSSRPGTAIYGVAYGTWTPGVAGTLTLRVYVDASGSYDLALNPAGSDAWLPPPGWSVPRPAGWPRPLEPGAHEIALTVTPPNPLTVLTSWGACRFALRRGAAALDTLEALLVVDPRSTGIAGGGGDAAALAAQYAPAIKMHRSSFYPPMPPERFFEAAALSPAPGRTLRRPPEPVDVGQIVQRDATLDLEGNTLAALRARFGELEPAAPRMYYTVAPLGTLSAIASPPANRTVIQYYLLFFADEWGLGRAGGHRHEGDWEVVQIELDESLAPVAVTASQQTQLARDGGAPGGQTRAWAAVERMGGTHPVLYAGAGNSLYFTPGSARYGTGLEEADGLGPWYLPAGAAADALDYAPQTPIELAPLGRLGEAANPAWLRFAGRWGQRDFPPGTDDAPTPETRTGALGPLFLGATADGAAAGVRSVWTDPYAWRVRMPAGIDPEPVEVTGQLPRAFAGVTLAFLDARGRVYRTAANEFDAAFAVLLPPAHYSVTAVETLAFGAERVLAGLRFPTDHPVANLVSVPPGAPRSLGTLGFDAGALIAPSAFDATDADGDGTPDAADPDRDNDGLPNPFDDDALGDGWADLDGGQDADGDALPRYYDADDDGDGTPDAADGDDDNNGTPDAEEPQDTDGDGVADAVDLDRDNDGFDNATETVAGTDPLLFVDRPGQRAGDLDGDGGRDAADLQLLVNMALGRSPFSPLADFNGNGAAETFDVQSLLRVVLTGAG